MANEHKGSRDECGVDRERVERLARHLAALVTELISLTNEMASRTESLRKKALVDMGNLLEELAPENQGILLTRVEFEVQRILDAQGSPKVNATKGCVGRSGGGITATDGGVSVGACGIVEGGKIIGGGVEGTFKY